jgi:AcrR family transcriptional regulator
MKARATHPLSRLSADERRSAIMSAAMPLFAAKGYDALTTKEIADAAGVSEALLYRHFESKHGLYEAVQITCIGDAAAEIRRLDALPDNTSTLVMAVYVLSAKIQGCLDSERAADNEMPRLMLRSLLTDGEFAAAFLKGASGPWIAKIEKCVKAAIEAGDLLESFDAGCLGVWFCHHLSVAMNVFALPGRGKVVQYPGDPEQLFESSVMFCLRGMGLTPEAITRHYNPKAFALMRAG